MRMLEALLTALLKHPSSNAWRKCLQQCVSSNAQTYKRTYKEQLTLRENLTLSNARRGAAKFRQLAGKT